jgi:hypothetical protein
MRQEMYVWRLYGQTKEIELFLSLLQTLLMLNTINAVYVLGAPYHFISKIKL